ncbi:MAG TPA: TonB-dependent receptor [Nitrospiria bacterium]
MKLSFQEVLRISLTFLILLGAFPFSVPAEGKKGGEDHLSDPISLHITATTPTRLEEGVDAGASSVTLIPSHEIEEKHPVEIKELVSELPGVRLQESGTLGEQISLSLRGANTNQTLILQDGIRLNDPFQGGFDFGGFMMDEISQIEIVPGGQSALYGADAVGGVVNMITRRASKPFQLSLQGEAGNERTFREGFSVEGLNHLLDYTLTVSHVTTHGQFERDRFRGISVAGQMGLSFGKDNRLSYIYRIQDSQKELGTEIIPNLNIDPNITTVGITVFDPNREIEREFYFHSVQFHGRVNPWLGLSWKAALVEKDLKLDNPNDSPLWPFPYFEDTDSLVLTLDLQQNIRLGKLDTFSFGFELRDESVDSVIEVFGSPPRSVNQSRQNLAYFFQNLFNWEDRFFLQTGVRVDDNSDFETVVNPKISMAYQIIPIKTKVRASLEKGFRAPSLADQFFPVVGNDNLRPERSVSGEIGLHTVYFEKVNWDLAFFWIEYEQLIQRNLTSAKNIGEAETHGVELKVNLYPISMLTIQGAYTLLDTKDKTSGERLAFRPENRGRISFLLSPLTTFSFNLDIYMVDSQKMPFTLTLLDGKVLTDKSPGYTTVNLSCNYYLLGGFLWFNEVRIYLKFRNLFDQGYESVPGFPAPGFGVAGGLKAMI